MEIRILPLSKEGWWSVNVPERLSLERTVYPDRDRGLTEMPALVRNLIGLGIGVTEVILMPYEVQIHVASGVIPSGVVHKYIRSAIEKLESKTVLKSNIRKEEGMEVVHISVPHGLIPEEMDGTWWNSYDAGKDGAPDIVRDVCMIDGVISVQTFRDELIVRKAHCLTWKPIILSVCKVIRFRLRTSK